MLYLLVLFAVLRFVVVVVVAIAVTVAVAVAVSSFLVIVAVTVLAHLQHERCGLVYSPGK